LSTYQLDLTGNDAVSQENIDERKAKFVELAAFMNAEPDEIGMSSSPVPSCSIPNAKYLPATDGGLVFHT